MANIPSITSPFPFGEIPVGTITVHEYSGGEFILEKIEDQPSNIHCLNCGKSAWNAWNGENTVHLCPNSRVEIFPTFS